MTDTDPVVRLPGNAFDAAGLDVLAPTASILGRLNLLPSPGDLAKADGFGSTFAGPPPSVAIIEAGATAASKWWSGAGAATIAGIWVGIRVFWNANSKTPDNQRMILLAAAIASAALILTIGYVLASDVRGRAEAMVATINARVRLADTMIEIAKSQPVTAAAASATDLRITGVTASSVKNLEESEGGEEGWTALALQVKSDGTDPQFLLAKGDKFAWVQASAVDFLKAL